MVKLKTTMQRSFEKQDLFSSKYSCAVPARVLMVLKNQPGLRLECKI